MFEERKISTEDALRLACKANGLKYAGTHNKPKKTITLVEGNGDKTIVNSNLDIVVQSYRKIAKNNELEAKQIKCKKYNCMAAKDNGDAGCGCSGRLIRKVYGEHNYIKVKPRKRNSE